MRKLIPLLKFHIKIQKFPLLTILAMPVLGILLSLSETISIINMGNKHSFSAIAFMSAFCLFYFALTTLQGFSSALQYSVRMSCTRKEYFLSYLVFFLLLSFLWSVLLVILFSIEALIFYLFGVPYAVELFNIVFINSFNAYTPFYIFSVYFSLVTALVGLAYFLNAFMSSFLKGTIMGISTATLLFIVYMLIQFTQFKIILLNFITINKGLMLSTKLFIVGISGFFLSWPFIEKIDIDRLKIKIR
jgi:hypothetical protein